jgi:HTH-type transcriptional regulator/antitoxin HigA
MTTNDGGGFRQRLPTIVDSFCSERVTGAALVRFLMDQHELRQADLPEIGPQSVVSEILSGRRELTLTHIRGLAKRFNLNPATFL